MDRVVRIAAAEGLHARPAALFVQTVKASGAAVTVTRGQKSADASSILGVLTLGAGQGDEVVLSSADPNAEAVLDRLVALLSDGSH